VKLVESRYVCYHQKGTATTMSQSTILREDDTRMPAPTSQHTVPSLRSYRVAHYLSQRALALQAGVATSTVARAEQGYSISLIAARKLADTLGVTVHALRATPADEEE
jgi:DNA-binding XRE family transcriptional regulator